jgi:phosphoribosyl-ATP pyrophosphohydrolase/phosphoribosyl-AMP cyclohydrolase
MDCDQDALLITAIPLGPTCHTGSTTCFGHSEISDENFLSTLEAIIAARQQSASDSSYTVKLFAAGMSRMAQKVGEEGVEVALAAMEKNPEKLCNEAADLLFHVLVLLRANNLSLADVNKVLQKRNQKK